MQSSAPTRSATHWTPRPTIALIRNSACALAMLLASIVLLGWLFDIPLLKTVLPGGAGMEANVAMSFLLLAISLQLLRYPKLNALRYTLCLLVMALSALTLLEYITGRSLGIDELLFRDLASPLFPGRMAPLSATSLFVLSIALILPGRASPFPVISQVLTLLAALGPAIGIVGYLYGVPLLYGSIHYTAMAFHTGVGLLLLTFCIAFADPDHGIVRIFLSDNNGGILARIAIPASIVIPVLLGYVFIHERFNFGEPRLGSALAIMSNSAAFVALIWALAFFLEAREYQWDRARLQANVDSLTGIMNRRYFEKRLAGQIGQSERLGGSFSLILFDVDHFKALNDSMGHLMGDQVLCAVAQVLRTGIRETDTLCRFGGEEFAVIAAGADTQDAFEMADDLRKAVEITIYPGSAHLHMTISGGVSTYPDHGSNRSQLLAAADSALYVSKTSGRNRIMTFGQPSPLRHRAATRGDAIGT